MTGPSKNGSATAAGGQQVSLIKLPDDVLHHIWTHLDKPDSVARTSRFFYALSKDVFWQSKWFMKRFEIYTVIYEAIARRKLFTPALFAQLRRLGAPLTVNLVQLLHVQFSPGARAHVEEEPMDWGRISFAAFSAVMNEAVKLHGETITFELDRFDSYIFREWMMEEECDCREQDNSDPQPSKEVRNMFKDGRFMPLPIAFEGSDQVASGFEVCARDNDVTGALSLDPGLIASAIDNGYTLNPERISELIDSWLEQFQDPKHDHFKRILNFARKLTVDSKLNITKEYAIKVFSDLEDSRTMCPSDDQVDEVYDLWRQSAQRRTRLAEEKRDILMTFDKANALPFRLADVIEELRPSASLCKSKRAREAEDCDEVLEVDSKGKPIKSKKIRRSILSRR